MSLIENMNIAPPILKQTQHKSRQLWLSNRKKLEALRFNRISERAKETGRITLLDHMLPLITLGLKTMGFYHWGFKNALDVALKQHELYFENLPRNFDGYKILHLSDLHIDCLPGLEDVICQMISGLEYDMCAITGDYRLGSYGTYKENVVEPLKKIADAITARDGIYATLGNHDTHHIVNILEEMGMVALTNETKYIRRGEEQMVITGTDDPYTYYTNQMVEALNTDDAGFKVALAHSPELYKEAAKNHYDLYLCGHTHAGQICLPTGAPLISHLKKGKHLVSDFWKEENMVGYTSAGCGTSGLPIRFNCRGEITLFTLRRK